MEIKTKNLQIRDLSLKDISDLVYIGNDLDVSKFVGHLPFPFSEEDAQKYVERAIFESQKSPRKNYEFGIENLQSQIIGVAHLSKVDNIRRYANIGIWFGKKYQNGINAKESFEALLEFAFQDLDLRRIDASCFEGCISNKLLPFFGFQHEGVRRQRGFSLATKEVLDEHIYGLLKEEYKGFRR